MPKQDKGHYENVNYPSRYRLFASLTEITDYEAWKQDSKIYTGT